MLMTATSLPPELLRSQSLRVGVIRAASASLLLFHGQPLKGRVCAWGVGGVSTSLSRS